jgi:hypothetical protein
MQKPKQRFTTAEAARYLRDELGVPVGTKKTLESWRCLGRGPAYRRLCGRIYYEREALELFARGQKIETVDSMDL